MTTLANKRPRDLAVSLPAQSRLVLAWSISPHAITRAGIATPRQHARLQIETPWPGRGELTALLIIDARRQTIVEPIHAAWTTDDAGLAHLDLPGILTATARPSPTPHILYAQTTLLARLNIQGGRYELEP